MLKGLLGDEALDKLEALNNVLQEGDQALYILEGVFLLRLDELDAGTPPQLFSFPGLGLLPDTDEEGCASVLHQRHPLSNLFFLISPASSRIFLMGTALYRVRASPRATEDNRSSS